MHRRTAAQGEKGSSLLFENPVTGEQWTFQADYRLPLHSRETVVKDPSTRLLAKFWILKNGATQVQEPPFPKQGRY